MRSPQMEPTQSSQKRPMRSPQKRPVRLPQTEPTPLPLKRPMRSPQTGPRMHEPRSPPVELDAKGQAFRKQLRAFRTQAVRKNYKVSMRLPTTLPLSPTVFKCVFLFQLSTHNSPRLSSLWPFLESAVMAIMAFVSQHKEISTRASCFCVAYQAPHAVAGNGTHAVAADGTRAVAGDGTHAVAGDGSHAVAADRHAYACAATASHRARRRGPGPLQTAPRIPHAGGEKNLQSFTRPPATPLLSPRVLKCIFPF